MNSVFGLVIKRIGLGILTLIAISIIFFMGVEALPGDLAEEILGQNALPETVAAFRKELKLDLPPHERYIAWLGDLMKGDLGKSLANGRPVVDLVGWRFANTLFLAISAAVIAVPVAILLGILAALYRNSLFDRAISIATLSTISFPEFFVAYILIALLSVQLIIFPSISNINDQMSFWQKIHAIVLPCLTLTLVVVAHMMRQTRAAIINILASPFIEMARLKGIKRTRVIVMHAFPNALSPVINVIATQSGLPGCRCCDRGGGICLSGIRPIDGGLGVQTGYPGGSGLWTYICVDLHRPQPDRRCTFDYQQP